VTGVSVLLGDSSAINRLVDERITDKLNNHQHLGNLGAPTSTPIVPFVSDDFTTTKTVAD